MRTNHIFFYKRIFFKNTSRNSIAKIRSLCLFLTVYFLVVGFGKTARTADYDYTSENSNDLRSNEYFHEKTDSLEHSMEAFFYAPPIVDLNGAANGVDFNIASEPQSGLVGLVVGADAFIATDSGNIDSSTISFAGVVDTNQEIIALFDGANNFIASFNLSTVNAQATASFGGTTLRVTNNSPGVFEITNFGGGASIPTADYNLFLKGFLYGNQLGTGGATEGARTMSVSITDSQGTTSANSFIAVHYFPNAVDDNNNTLASNSSPIAGDLVSNDNDLTAGDILSVVEVNGFPASVGMPYNSTYGSITVQSNGSYSYNVDTENIAVLGLTSGLTLTDIISYGVVDAAGNIDYGFITITIDGVDESPIATDNANNITVGASAAEGNVLFDDDGFGVDSSDRPIAQFIWEDEFSSPGGVFVNYSAPINGQSRTESSTGVTLTFTSTDPAGMGIPGQNQVVAQTATNGGHTGYLLFAIDADTNPSPSTTLTIDFDEPVVNLSFSLSDIDWSQIDAWQDQMTVSGNLDGTLVNFVPQVSGSVIQVGSDTFYGTGSVPPDDAHGNISIYFRDPIDQLTLSYNYGPDATAADNSGQIAGVFDLNWQSSTIPRVYEVDGQIADVGNQIATTYGFITINGNGTYDYIPDNSNPLVAQLPIGSTLTDVVAYTLIDSIDGTGDTATANLTITINGSWIDSDGDGQEDSLDLDDDNDGITDTEESGSYDLNGDEDGDGILNWKDTTDDGTGDGSTTDYEDSNADGIADVYDFDNDGVPNHLDLDSDNDGIYDVVEAGGTLSLTPGQEGRADDDDDNTDNSLTNGIPSSAGAGLAPTKTTTAISDYLNLDSDGDLCSDANEAYDSSTTDGGDTGVYGVDPATVNNIGLVDGAPYNTGAILAVITADVDLDNDGLVGACELDDDGDGDPNITDPDAQDPCVYSNFQVLANVSLFWEALDCDGDGVTNAIEIIDFSNPLNLCDFELASINVTPSPTWNATDCDGDGVINGTEIMDGTNPLGACSYFASNVTETVTSTSDCDSDGVIDATEIANGTNPKNACSYNVADITEPITATTDCDGDGVIDATEVNNGTDPKDDCSYNVSDITEPITATIDCDGDGVIDATEVANGTDPKDACSYNVADITETVTATSDCDGDGVIDATEIANGTDPKDSCSYNVADITETVTATSDCDGDGVIDTTEIANGTNPKDSCSYNVADITETVTATSDCDGDGVINTTEFANGTNPNDECSYNVVDITVIITSILDCDGDGVLNVTEIADGTDPADFCDYDFSNVTLVPSSSWNLADCDQDTIANGQELIDNTDPQDPCDSVGGIAPEAANCNIDSDGDTILDDQEVIDGTNPLDDCDSVGGIPLGSSDCDQDGLSNQEEGILNTDPNNSDSDGDSISDGQEVLDNTNPLDDCDSLNGISSDGSDCDNDGLTKIEEIEIGTDPDNNDSDSDGVFDGKEIEDNTNPLDSCDSIGGNPPSGVICDIEIANELVTPNGDGVNDVFQIRNLEAFPNNTVEIYNRWGVKVFSVNGYDNTINVFRGISNGRITIEQSDKLPSGVYFFVISYEKEGSTRSKSGYLYINQQ